MATWSDVRALALALPETDEHPSYGGLPAWRVKGHGFVWDRPLRQKDLQDLLDQGRTPPEGPVLGARVADVGVAEALIADDPDVFFTVPHLDGYPAVLARLDRLTPSLLREVVEEAWLARAPKRLRAAHLAESGADD